MALGRAAWKATRSTLTELLSTSNAIRDNESLRSKALVTLPPIFLLTP
jgi:hypothetical protein